MCIIFVFVVLFVFISLFVFVCLSVRTVFSFTSRKPTIKLYTVQVLKSIILELQNERLFKEVYKYIQICIVFLQENCYIMIMVINISIFFYVFIFWCLLAQILNKVLKCTAVIKWIYCW